VNYDIYSQLFIKLNIIFFIIFAVILIYISIVDMKCLSIGFAEILILSIFTLIYSILKILSSGNIILLDICKGIVFSLIFFLVVILLTRSRGIGLGDMIFFVLASINIGFNNSIEAICIAFIVGMFYSIFLILSKRSDVKTRIPFIPFLSIGVILSLFIRYF